MNNFTTNGFDITDIRYDKNGNYSIYYKKWNTQRSKKLQLLSITKLLKYSKYTKMELLTNTKFLQEVNEIITDRYL